MFKVKKTGSQKQNYAFSIGFQILNILFRVNPQIPYLHISKKTGTYGKNISG
jgi:hypothetical protein